MGIQLARTTQPTVAAGSLAQAGGLTRAAFGFGVFTWVALAVIARNPSFLHIWVGTPFLLYGVYLVLARRLPGPTPLDWWVGGLIGISALSVLTAADPDISAEVALARAAALVAFYLVLNVKELTFRLVVRTFVVVAILASTLAILNVTLQYLRWIELVRLVSGQASTSDLIPPTLPRVAGILGHPNILAMFLNLALPLAAVLALKPKTAGDRYLGVAGLLVGSLAMFFTLSRGGWLGAITWILILAVLVTKSRHPKVLLFAGRVVKARARLFLALGLPVFLAVAGASAFAVVTRPQWLFRATIGDRFDAASVAASIARDHWLIGAGPGSYATLFDRYKGSGLTDIFPHAHNLYFSTISEIGLVGSVVVLAGSFILGRLLFRAWRTSGPDQTYVAAIIAGLGATLVHSLVDLPLHWNTVMLPLAILLGVALRGVTVESSLPRTALSRLDVLPRLAVLLLIPVVLVAWVRTDEARASYDKSITLAAAEDYPVESVQFAIDAAEKDPRSWAYQLNAGVSLIELYESGETAPGQDGLAEGVRFLEKARDINANSSLVHANLAIGYRLQDNPDDAVREARNAIAYSPLYADVYKVAATTFEWAGLPADAVDAYASAVELDPSLTQSPFWLSQPGSLRTDVLAKADVKPCDLARSAALYGVFTDELSTLAGACQSEFESSAGSTNRASLVIALSVLGRNQDAQALFESASTADKGSPDMRLARALLDRDQPLGSVRQELNAAGRVGNLDARALLVASYDRPSESESSIRVPLPAVDEGLPLGLKWLARAEANFGERDETAAQGRMTHRYFMTETMRTSPPIVIASGDWNQLLSPRTILGLYALEQLDATTGAD